MNQALKQLHKNLCASVIGCDKTAQLLIVGIIANGHVMLEGAPGIGKTSLAKALAKSMACTFSRIQFTPDLLPADILGFSLYNATKHDFEFRRGPLFNQIVLADEINRATPRVQSALLEAMNEHQVTVDGTCYELAAPFFVIATRNTLYSTGTFPLPEPQLDRFLLSLSMQAPSPENQVAMLELHHANGAQPIGDTVLCQKTLLEIQDKVRQVSVDRKMHQYIVGLAESSRENSRVICGVSPRASIALMRASQAYAFTEGRDHVYPDDVKAVIHSVFSHRLQLSHGSQHGEQALRDVVDEIVSLVAVP